MEGGITGAVPPSVPPAFAVPAAPAFAVPAFAVPALPALAVPPAFAAVPPALAVDPEPLAPEPPAPLSGLPTPAVPPDSPFAPALPPDPLAPESPPEPSLPAPPAELDEPEPVIAPVLESTPPSCPFILPNKPFESEPLHATPSTLVSPTINQPIRRILRNPPEERRRKHVTRTYGGCVPSRY